MKPGSTSIARQSDTHAPHWMQAIVWVTSTIDSFETRYSRSGTGCLASSHGVTRWIFFQWTASMSTIRSLITGMLPIGSISITPPRAGSRAASKGVGEGGGVGGAGARGFAVPAPPAGAADRLPAGAADADRAVEAVFRLQHRLQHRAVGLELDGVLVPVGRLAGLGVV